MGRTRSSTLALLVARSPSFAKLHATAAYCSRSITWATIMGDTLAPTVDGIKLRSKTPRLISKADVDRLARLLKATDLSCQTYASGVRCLRRICRSTGHVPTSCVISTNIEKGNEISRTHFSTVYTGSLGERRVAIKVLWQGNKDASRLQKTYLNEVVVWQHLRHPNIVPFLGTVGGQDLEVAFISEWMDGGTVREFLRNEPEYDRSTLVRDIVCGLAFMHSLNVIHGDIKPSNILIDCRHRARLADFGLARITTVTTSGSTSHQSGGTTRYMAPELFQPGLTSTTSGKDGLPTKQSDVYALGVTTWEIYSEETPFAGCTPYGAVLRVVEGKRPECTLSMIKRGMNGVLWDHIQKWWSHNPQKRLLSQPRSQPRDRCPFK